MADVYVNGRAGIDHGDVEREVRLVCTTCVIFARTRCRSPEPLGTCLSIVFKIMQWAVFRLTVALMGNGFTMRPSSVEARLSMLATYLGTFFRRLGIPDCHMCRSDRMMH